MAELVDPDVEHLRLLAIFHYVDAGLTALFASFALLYVVMGVFMVVQPEAWGGHGEVPPPAVGFFLAIMGAGLTLAGWGFAVCLFFVGRMLNRRRHYVYCLVVAGINCIFVPIGTVLGVFTIVVLMRPSVKALFAAAGAPPAPMGTPAQ
jgi:hypothetical protein